MGTCDPLRLLSQAAVVFSLVALPGCQSAALRVQSNRIDALELRLQTLETALEPQALRSESVAVGLEKLSERVDRILPPSGQWLALENGSAIKWYVDDQLQNVYVQYQEWDESRAILRVAISSRAGSEQHALRLGEGVEHRWNALSPPRTFVVTLHQILRRSEGTRFAQFSIQELGDAPLSDRP